jgi:hypothetical protein
LWIDQWDLNCGIQMLYHVYLQVFENIVNADPKFPKIWTFQRLWLVVDAAVWHDADILPFDGLQASNLCGACDSDAVSVEGSQAEVTRSLGSG